VTAAKAVYTVEELVELLDGRRGRTAIYEDLRRGRIPRLKLGRQVFIPGAFVAELLGGAQLDHGERRGGGDRRTRERRSGGDRRAGRDRRAVFAGAQAPPPTSRNRTRTRQET
jgi:hypothetical protein